MKFISYKRIRKDYNNFYSLHFIGMPKYYIPPRTTNVQVSMRLNVWVHR